jgi:hypothetical protein
VRSRLGSFTEAHRTRLLRLLMMLANATQQFWQRYGCSGSWDCRGTMCSASPATSHHDPRTGAISPTQRCVAPRRLRLGNQIFGDLGEFKRPSARQLQVLNEIAVRGGLGDAS